MAAAPPNLLRTSLRAALEVKLHGDDAYSLQVVELANNALQLTDAHFAVVAVPLTSSCSVNVVCQRAAYFVVVSDIIKMRMPTLKVALAWADGLYASINAVGAGGGVEDAGEGPSESSRSASPPVSPLHDVTALVPSRRIFFSRPEHFMKQQGGVAPSTTSCSSRSGAPAADSAVWTRKDSARSLRLTQTTEL